MIIDDIALTLETRITPRVIAHLIEHFGSAQAVYEASAQQLIDIAELVPELACQIVKRQNHRLARKEMEYTQKYGITAIEATSNYYPILLKECADYPHVIYYKGDTSALTAPMLTMVGTRNITNYGAKVCDELIKSLAEIMPELVIVSGLAYGIDIACHRAALRHGLRTVGVIASCLPSITPTHHIDIAADMMRHGGGVISEINTQSKTHKGQFIRRNRILAAMSSGTVIVESQQSGGSLITAQLADGYGRVVMAVPGRIDDLSSVGTNSLIRALKARIVCSGADIADEMCWEVSPDLRTTTQIDTSTWSKDQIGLYSCFTDGAVVSVDTLINRTGLSINILMSLLLELEFLGVIRSLPGSRYEKFS